MPRDLVPFDSDDDSAVSLDDVHVALGEREELPVERREARDLAAVRVGVDVLHVRFNRWSCI